MSEASTRSQMSDAQERAQALNPRTSFLVQAPAGSGKTELLVLRYLALLPQVEEPEQILAITFTRKATAEMRVRVLEALELARQHERTDLNEHQRTMHRLAQAALAHADALGWNLIEQPQRLNIQTIDSLALSIASRLPLLSRMNGRLTPIDDAGTLYSLAASRTMAQLGDPTEPQLAEALSEILRLRDVNLGDCEALIARMLAQRDQWLLAVPDIAVSNLPWKTLQAELEAPFRRAHERALQAIHSEAAPVPHLVEELLDLARIACDNGQEHLAPLRELRGINELRAIQHWECLSQLLLKKDGDWRTRITAAEGFPAVTHRNEGTRLKEIVRQLANREDLLRALRHLRKLPPAAYSPEESRTVRSIFSVLRYAIAHLRVVFSEQGVIDFAEAGIGARAALEIPGVRMRLDEQIRHLLVDEFQDTSRPHFALLQTLLDDWQPDESRTCFLVGDPMQSIYLFRNADPRLFSQVRERGFAIGNTSLPLMPLRLSTNFRSLPAIVEPLNQIFARVLDADPESGVELARAISNHGKAMPGEDAVHMHIQISEPTDTRTAEELNRAEADEMLAIIRGHEKDMAAAQRDGSKFRIAVLARNRSHLAAIISCLHQESIPFRGIKIDHLQDRQEIIDLLSLLRALLHPADRIAWLAVLRAPWCGLTLPALHALCGDEAGMDQSQTVPALLRARAGLLDMESRRRALHVLSILNQAQTAYADGALAASPAGLALWLERTWHALGASRYLADEARSNCDAFFSALATMPSGSFGALDPNLWQQLQSLFAQPDPLVSEDCGVQLMTIHQAKGLEFEIVLVPQLHRAGKPDDPPLFQWLLEERDGGRGEDLLLAPIGYKHGDALPLYEWVGRKVRHRLYQEAKRLLYVACSRAIRELHLFATVRRRANGQIAQPGKDTLLGAGWAGLEPRILEAADAEAARPTACGNIISMPLASNGIVATMAAQAELVAQQIKRLPIEYFSEAAIQREASAHKGFQETGSDYGITAGRFARVQGIALHAILERAAAGPPLPDWPRVADAMLRQYGLAPADLHRAREAVLRGIQNALTNKEGRWLLQPRQSNVWTESGWSTYRDGRMTRQRPDRVFLGGNTPSAPGTDCLWIVDYKTASLPADSDRDAFVRTSREQYQEQLTRYSALFRQLQAVDADAATRPHRLAIYHPMLPWLDWWPG